MRNAQSGGVSRLTSAISVHNTMAGSSPEALARFYRGYLQPPRRGATGRVPYTPYLVPVFSNTDGCISARYVRTYVGAGETAGGRPMNAAERSLDR
jgi:hypothetical protein